MFWSKNFGQKKCWSTNFCQMIFVQNIFLLKMVIKSFGKKNWSNKIFGQTKIFGKKSCWSIFFGAKLGLTWGEGVRINLRVNLEFQKICWSKKFCRKHIYFKKFLQGKQKNQGGLRQGRR